MFVTGSKEDYFGKYVSPQSVSAKSVKLCQSLAVLLKFNFVKGINSQV